MTPQQLFILDELWILAWGASVQRAKVFVDGEKDTKVFRATIKRFVRDNLLDHYKSGCDEGQHYRNIGDLVAFASRTSPELLRDGSYRYGAAQKVLNLLLKYYWCLGHIPEPPHCPVDRIVIQHTHLRGKVNWTDIRTEGKYREVIEAIRQVAGHKSLARWELDAYERP